MKVTDVNELKNIAKKVRVDILDEIYYAKSGHPGGALSCADILTVLYFNEMKLCLEGDECDNLDETIESDIDEDRFILYMQVLGYMLFSLKEDSFQKIYYILLEALMESYKDIQALTL